LRQKLTGSRFSDPIGMTILNVVTLDRASKSG
jgi:hypothetical protein